MTASRNAVHGRILASSGDQVDGRRSGLRQRRRHDPRRRPDGRLAGPDDGIGRRVEPDRAAPLGELAARRGRRQPAAQRGQHAAVAGAAADQRAAGPPVRLHPARRADQLLCPPATRSARVGVGHDAPPRRRLRGGRVPLRQHPARRPGDHQLGGHRPGCPGYDRGERHGLCRRVLTDPRDLPAGDPRRGPPLAAGQRRVRLGLQRGPERGDPRHPPGRDGSSPRPGGGLWLAPGGPGRGAGRRTAGERRPPPRRRPPQGHPHQQVDHHPREAGHRPRRIRRRARRPGPGRQRRGRPAGRHELARAADLGPHPGRRVPGRRPVRQRRRRPAGARPPGHPQPAHVRPEHRDVHVPVGGRRRPHRLRPGRRRGRPPRRGGRAVLAATSSTTSRCRSRSRAR